MNRGVAGCAAVPSGLRVWNGTVCAVFARSVHVKTDSGFVTLGSSILSPHPCSILWPGFTSGWTAGQRIRISSEELRTDDGYVVPLSGMRHYTPSFLSRETVKKAALPGALRATRDALASMASKGGFHAIYKESIGCGEKRGSRLSGALEKLGGKRSAALAASMRRHDWNAFQRAADALVGWGEGLTPAGDDFLGGVLAAMRYYGRSTGSTLFPDDLTQELAERSATKTTPFSGFLLRLSAGGLVGLPFSRWLRATHRGDVGTISTAVEQAANIGHSSGLDTLTGMLLALQVLNKEEPWTRC